ncbi:hypothetical protein [Marinobacter sp.]|jgi:hypothetical protein|nr:hypothetical protein [Marinobacter sp.]
MRRLICVRRDPFFKSAMGIKQSPSSARLGQRFDEDAQGLPFARH